MIRATVGVAPGTTTLRLNGTGLGSTCLGGPNCPPNLPSGSSWVPPKGWQFSELNGMYRIYGDEATLRGRSTGLGMVLSPYGKVPGAYPWEINRTGPNNAPQLTPFDPQYNQRGERGYYYDTPLGGSAGLGVIPTDAEQGRNLCYTPVQSGWIYGNNSYIPPSWVPPDGWYPTGPDKKFAPPTSLSGLSGGQLGSFIDDITVHNRLILFFTALSSIAIATTAYFTITRGRAHIPGPRRG